MKYYREKREGEGGREGGREEGGDAGSASGGREETRLVVSKMLLDVVPLIS